MINIVLVAPEIPGNTGSIGRSCVATNSRLHLIRPYGFNLDEKSVRRAGLDYWKHVDLAEHDSFEAFLAKEMPSHLYFFSKLATKSVFEAKIEENAYLIFGSETKGLPAHLFRDFAEDFYTLPMSSDRVRSLNLACAATAALYESIRQLS